VAHQRAGSEKSTPDNSADAGSRPAAVSQSPPGPGLAFSFKDKYELEHMEDTILQAEDRVAELTARVQDPDIMGHPDQLADICRDLEKAETRVQTLYARWEELEKKKADAGK
jgi:ATP-binding cassette subfamily F protein uup